jgi:sterol desaturase/sphingolipid hydroxylase (fatty acid hydroxylase superfamily)
MISVPDKQLVIGSLLVILYVLECVFPYFDSFRMKSAHTLSNGIIIGFNAIILNLFLVPVALYSMNTQWGLFNLVSMHKWLELLLTILSIDLLTYFLHVAYHRIPFLWRFHRMHHSDTEMDVTTGARFHIGEHACSLMVRCVLYSVLALKSEFVLLYELLFLSNVFFHHANLSMGSKLDQLYRILLTSPDMHKVHHSDVRDEADSNYTSLFSFWDRIFGTFKILPNPKQIVYGVKGLKDHQTVAKMLLTPFKD